MPAVVVTAALLLVVLAAHVVPAKYGRDAPPHYVPVPTATATLPSQSVPRGGRSGPEHTHPLPTIIASYVLLGLIAAGLIWGLTNVLLTRLRSGRREWRTSRLDHDTGTATALLDRRIESAVDEGLDELAHGPVTDAIIACWQRLEDAATTAGVAPHRSDTPTDTVVRVLGQGRARPEPLETLADLYREARFSRHEMGEPSRAAARAALEAIRADLARTDARADTPGGVRA